MSVCYIEKGVSGLLFYFELISTEEDRSKFEKIYIEYKLLMKYIALNILKNDELANEAVHDAFIKIINHLDSIDQVYSHKTKSFIAIVIRNVSIDNLRKEHKHRYVNIEEINKSVFSEDNVFQKLTVEEIIEKLQELPDTYRDILELKVYYELSDKKIADILGISHAAARKRLERARIALNNLLSENIFK